MSDQGRVRPWQSPLLRQGAVLVLLAGIYLATGNKLSPGRHDPHANRGIPAPAFDLPEVQAAHAGTQQGARRVSFAQLSGKPFIVHFWASWCTSCRDEKPRLAKLMEQAQQKGLVVVAIATDDSAEAVAKSDLAPFAMARVLLDADGKIARAYKVQSVPQTFLVGADGRLKWEQRGAMAELHVRDLLRRL